MVGAKLALAAIVVAAPVNAAPVLWNDLQLGMTKAQVEQAYPTKRTPIGEGCEAKIYPRFSGDSLNRLGLGVFPTPKDGLGGRMRCAKQIREGLVSKYGEPLGTKLHQGDVYYDSHYSLYDYWRSGEILITFGVDKLSEVGTIGYEYSPQDQRKADTSKL